jgi:hypothetical protein
VSTLLHATVYMFLHSLLNVLVQIANKMGLQKNLMNNEKSKVTNISRLGFSSQIRKGRNDEKTERLRRHVLWKK